MPCFKGLAVSIHTPEGPLPEHAVQKQSRASRISTYIPVPPARIPANGDATKAEQSTFAISITLLTPGQDVPYSTPKPSAQNPIPRPRVVGALPGHDGNRGNIQGAIGPYVPLTTSPNETIAAYIYFDGRAKEEVATLLRRSEETWVNSRWVSVPDSEGGGLAEREFLFREVGIERWLNGLDLEGGKDAAAIIEKRRQKLERKRRKRKDTIINGSDDEMDKKEDIKKKTLRYGPNGDLQDVSDDEHSLTDSETSDDDDPIPEAAGQIKIALFRVLASGEIKRGEYSPQFDAHDDDEEANGQNGSGGSKDIDHTTSFAKPKTLDPKTISTQTVTGIDPTDKPYATFTFFYRGERQLQKMGILETTRTEKTPISAKRRSVINDLPSLGPLKKEGTIGFLNYRETDARSRRKSKVKAEKSADDMESDDSEDDEVVGKMDDLDDTKRDPNHLSIEDAERAGQVSEGIRKMKLKRQHSAEPLNQNGATAGMRKSSKGNSGTASPSATGSPAIKAVGEDSDTAPSEATTGAIVFGTSVTETKTEDNFQVGSPFKKQRSSMADFDNNIKDRLAGSGLTSASNSINEIVGSGTTAPATNDTTGASHNSEPAAFSGLKFGGSLFKKQDDNDEEL